MQASLRQRSSNGLEFLASYTLGKGTTNNRGFYGVFGGTGLQGVTSATEGAYWQNTYDPEAEWGPAFHDVRHNLVALRRPTSCRSARDGTWGREWSGLTDALLGGWRLGGIFQARSGLPITVTDGRAPSLQGERGSERPNCVGDWKPADQSINHWLDITAFQPCRSARSATARSASRGRPATRTSTWCCRSGSRSAVRDTPSSGSRRSTPSTTRASGRRRATSRRRTRSASSRTRSAHPASSSSR